MRGIACDEMEGESRRPVKTREYEHYYFFGAEVLRCLGMCGGGSSLRASSCLVLYVMRFTT
jgi:hypothetical protein